jgi:guanidinopropionase
MDGQRPDLRPLDSSVIPRDADVATFMRAPRVDRLGDVDIGVFGVPLDCATFRGGTRLGPAAVREASRGIRSYHPRSNTNPFEQANVADLGDVPVNVLDYPGTLSATADFAGRLREAGVAPLAIGGDHSLTLGVLRGLAADSPLGMVQFDAHADIQDVFFGTRDNHATLMRRATEEELVDPKRVVQLGLRGTRFAGRGDLDWGREAGFTILEYDDYEERGRTATVALIREVVGDRPVYITFDIDGLDPSQAPGTPAREPGGFSMRDSQVILRGLSGLDVVGADVAEVAPPLDPVGLTATNAANLMFELLCLISQARLIH